jgi:acyl carrier protein
MLAKNHIVELSAELTDAITEMIKTVSAKARKVEITPETLLVEELELDSLDLVRVLMLIEDRYHVAIDLDEVPKMRQVHDLSLALARESSSAA